VTAGYARFSGLLLVNAAGSRNEVGAFPGLHPLGRIPSGAILLLSLREGEAAISARRLQPSVSILMGQAGGVENAVFSKGPRLKPALLFVGGLRGLKAPAPSVRRWRVV